jgi:hypothetical protein
MTVLSHINRKTKERVRDQRMINKNTTQPGKWGKLGK